MTRYRPRELASRTAAALAEMPVVVVTGLRQAGKSTFLRHEPCLRDRAYATLRLSAFLGRTPRCRAAILAHAGAGAAALEDRLFAVPLASLLE